MNATSKTKIATVGDSFQLKDLDISIVSARIGTNGNARTFDRHINPDGSRGGFVETTESNPAKIGSNVTIHYTSVVLRGATIEDNSVIEARYRVSPLGRLHYGPSAAQEEFGIGVRD